MLVGLAPAWQAVWSDPIEGLRKSAQRGGVGSADPWSYAATAAIIIGTAVLSAGVPALRAAAIDPVVALRAE